MPVAGAVIVTTPQEIAVADARKGLKMFEKVSVPVLGVVENMSTHVCSNCGHEDAICSATAAASALARECGVELLGALPLDAPHPRGIGRRPAHRGRRAGLAARPGLSATWRAARPARWRAARVTAAARFPESSSRELQ